ncbi:MAG: hypothetical protein R3C02_23200 [Planctomycetaceae bacterium]
MIDLDPQAHASLHLGVEEAGKRHRTIYQVGARKLKTSANSRRQTSGWPQPTSIWLPPSWVGRCPGTGARPSKHRSPMRGRAV